MLAAGGGGEPGIRDGRSQGAWVGAGSAAYNVQ